MKIEKKVLKMVQTMMMIKVYLLVNLLQLSQ